MKREKGSPARKWTMSYSCCTANKTQFEDAEQFINSLKICRYRYCIDKLCAKKNVARCAFNRLAVIETPQSSLLVPWSYIAITKPHEEN